MNKNNEDYIRELLAGAFLTKDWTELSKFYKANPPSRVIDDSGIKHQKEIPLPGDYDKIPCKCGKIHLEDENTWYHSTLEMTKGVYKVIKKCKKCHEVLMLELKL
jgi:hypothetical protein